MTTQYETQSSNTSLIQQPKLKDYKLCLKSWTLLCILFFTLLAIGIFAGEWVTTLLENTN